MADASDTIRIADKTTVTYQLAVNSDGSINVVPLSSTGALSNVSITGIPTVSLVDTTIDDYEAVAASTTGVLGATGAVGDYLKRILLIPGSTTAAVGTVSIRDGSTATAMNIHVTSAAFADNKAINIDIGAKSVIGGWNVLTGANVSVIAFGKFT